MNDFIKNTPFHKIAMITFKSVSSTMMYHYDIFYVLKGAIRIQTENGNFFLDEQDVILLNPHETYSVYGSNDNLVLSVIIDNAAFGKGQSVHTGQFVCNSSIDHHRNYSELRRQLARIASVYFDKKDINNLHLAALGYQLLYYLNSSHYEENLTFHAVSADNKYSDRINDILTYISEHYREQISLQELADYTHLSASYLSKFFKKNMQTNFNQYLNHIRLHHALDDLLHTNHSILNIAQDNGFPNMNAFNKLFKEEYHTTPNKYRIQLSKQDPEDFSSEAEVYTKQNSEENLHILDQFTDTNIRKDSDITLLDQTDIHILNDTEPVSIKPLWCSMLNIASADEIYKHKVEKILYNTLDEIRFHYGRIYHIFSPQFIAHKSTGTAYTYYSFTEAIDMLKSAGVRPYIELSENLDFIIHPANSLKTDFSINLDEYLDMISSLLTFSINLYGIGEVGSWIFEISWYCYYNNGMWESPKAFARRFTETYKLIKSYVPQAAVGGIGYDSPVPSNHFSEILEELFYLDATPDFISFGIFPYEYTHPWNSNEGHPPKLFYTSDSHYALHKITEYKRLMHRYKNFRCPIHVSALATSMHQSIVLNDSCYQASFFAQSTIDLVNEVDIIGYFHMADITFRKQENIHLLGGKNGLINVFGIYKPGLLALSIMNQSGLRLIDKGENYLITQRHQNSYSVFLCNHIHVNDNFCINMNDNLALEDTYAAFNPPQTKYIQFRIDNLQPGNYVITGYHINREMGSLLDEWAKIDYWNHPDRNELNYLKHIIHYKRTLTKRICKDGDNYLSFPIQLAPHEVAIYLVTLMTNE